MFAFLVQNMLNFPLQVTQVILVAAGRLTNAAANISGQIIQRLVLGFIHGVLFIIHSSTSFFLA